MTSRELISTTCTSGGVTLGAYASVCIIISLIGLIAAPNRHYQHKAVDLMALSFGGVALSSALFVAGRLTED
mgnify:CR=1 FL=1